MIRFVFTILCTFPVWLCANISVSPIGSTGSFKVTTFQKELDATLVPRVRITGPIDIVSDPFRDYSFSKQEPAPFGVVFDYTRLPHAEWRISFLGEDVKLTENTLIQWKKEFIKKYEKAYVIEIKDPLENRGNPRQPTLGTIPFDVSAVLTHREEETAWYLKEYFAPLSDNGGVVLISLLCPVETRSFHEGNFIRFVKGLSIESEE